MAGSINKVECIREGYQMERDKMGLCYIINNLDREQPATRRDVQRCLEIFTNLVDCLVGEWTAWESCSISCFGGMRSTTRRVTRQPLGGGKKCPVLSTTQKCDTQLCPDQVALIVGGVGETRNKVELWSPGGKCNRELKDLPDGEHDMTTNYINVNGGLILSCGGYTWKNKCYSMNVHTEEWVFHSTMLKSRRYHSSIVFNDTTLYLIGGIPTDSGSTTEYLEPGSTVWKEGPTGNVKVGAKRHGTCSVQTSANTFVVHGGSNKKGVILENEYSFLTKNWTRFGNSAEAWRHYHGCAIVQTKDISAILIAGGYHNNAPETSFFLDLKSNSPEWRKSFNTNFPHQGGRILKLNGRYFILGGGRSTMVEEYHPENETWTTGLIDVLFTRDKMYGTTAVPRNMFSNCN